MEAKGKSIVKWRNCDRKKILVENLVSFNFCTNVLLPMAVAKEITIKAVDYEFWGFEQELLWYKVCQFIWCGLFSVKKLYALNKSTFYIHWISSNNLIKLKMYCSTFQTVLFQSFWFIKICIWNTLKTD